MSGRTRHRLRIERGVFDSGTMVPNSEQVGSCLEESSRRDSAGLARPGFRPGEMNWRKEERPARIGPASPPLRVLAAYTSVRRDAPGDPEILIQGKRHHRS